MKTTILGLVCLAALSVTSAAAAATAELAAPIHQFIDAFNKGDGKTAGATHLAAGVTIIDEVPPYIWQGPKAFETWVGDLTKNDAAAGITEEKVTLGAVTREVVSPQTAYVIVAATYSFKQKGVAMREPAQMTFALTKTAEGWKIAGWTWTGPDPVPAK
ncbi:MAG: nuclear transport factor 2 family protein [Phenylobacterium sp.]